MKTAVIYPLFLDNGKYPLLSQNRQFKFTNSSEIKIFPVLLGNLITWAKEWGEILFLDAVNERLTNEIFENKLFEFNPDYIIIETKAPIFTKTLEYINYLKTKLNSKIFLVGDHLAFDYKTPFEKSKVDYVITDGFYDFRIKYFLSDINNNNQKETIYYGILDKNNYNNFNKSDVKLTDFDLGETPIIDREICKLENYGEAYLDRPVAYVMSGRGCGGDGKTPGQCTFCVWQYNLWKVKAYLRPVKNFVDELEYLYKNYHVKEVFDDNDSSFVWNLNYMHEFYEEMKRRDLLGKFYISANTRADLIDQERIDLMKKLNFRLLKVGLESGNDETLKIIKKNTTLQQIKDGIKLAKKNKLKVLITSMVGYPWEDEQNTVNTHKALKELMLYKTHFGDSLQSSIVVPYPGTPLYYESIKNNWFKIDYKNLDNFDMSKDLLKSQIDTTYWCRKNWRIHLHPIFLLKSLFSIRSVTDFKIAFRGIKSLLGHLRDY